MDFMAGGGDPGTLGLGLVIAGVVSGVVAGMLGTGGGIVIVPVLYYVLSALGLPQDLRMHLATGTALAILVPASISALHARKAAVDWALVKRWAVPMLAGVAAGCAVAAVAPGQVLALVFAAVALPVAAELVFAKENWRILETPPRAIGGALMAFVLGGVSVVMGISGGSLAVPAMRLSGAPTGTASAFAPLITVPGAIAAVVVGWNAAGLPPYSYGYVNLLAFGIIAPLVFFIAPYGASIAHLADTARLRKMFALFVAITAVKMIWDVVG